MQMPPLRAGEVRRGSSGAGATAFLPREPETKRECAFVGHLAIFRRGLQCPAWQELRPRDFPYLNVWTHRLQTQDMARFCTRCQSLFTSRRLSVSAGRLEYPGLARMVCLARQSLERRVGSCW
jgi:hypothetical protein